MNGLGKIDVTWTPNAHKFGDIVIYKAKKNSQLARCSSDYDCSLKNENSLFEQLNVSTINLNKTKHVHITFMNVSSLHEGEYRVEQTSSDSKKFNDSCYFSIFERPKDVACNYTYMNNISIVVICTANTTFHNVMCIYYNVCEQIHILGNVSNKPEKKTNIVHYKTVCSLHLDIYVFDNKDKIQVIVYPNVTGDETDVQYGSNFSIYLYEVKPSTEFSTTEVSNCDFYEITTSISQTTENITFLFTQSPFVTTFHVDIKWVSLLISTVFTVTLAFVLKFTGCFSQCRVNYSVKRIKENQKSKYKEVITFDNYDIYNLRVYVKNMEDTYCTIDEARVMNLKIQNSVIYYTHHTQHNNYYIT
ncbi:uncharacterized protein LOC129922864 isoform X2 [Biomphalaria glabrata]|nr:uncharacterized protein LOC129922864 isoform X2 [Biomphalaria glabrata]